MKWCLWFDSPSGEESHRETFCSFNFFIVCGGENNWQKKWVTTLTRPSPLSQHKKGEGIFAHNRLMVERILLYLNKTTKFSKGMPPPIPSPWQPIFPPFFFLFCVLKIVFFFEVFFGGVFFFCRTQSSIIQNAHQTLDKKKNVFSLSEEKVELSQTILLSFPPPPTTSCIALV